MERSWCFTGKKFCSLSERTQHKKCAELLKELLSTNHTAEKKRFFLLYKTLLSWITLDKTVLRLFSLDDTSYLEEKPKKLIDCYHWHLDMAKSTQKEHNIFCMQKDHVKAKKEFLDIHIYLDNLRSCHNIGNIIRTAEALRIGSVHLSHEVNEDKIQKSTMGTDKWLNWTTNSSIDDLPSPLIALEVSDIAIAYYDFTFPKKCTLVLGNEAYGVSDHILEKADVCIQIPLYGKKHSLNVANAFAIIASYIAKEHHLKDSE